MKTRELREEEVEFVIDTEFEDTPVKGSFESDDPEADQALGEEILYRLNRGDIWAWCCVKVTAKWKNWRGVSYLGACSYKNESEFKSDACWPDLRSEALSDLNKSIAECAKSIADLMCE